MRIPVNDQAHLSEFRASDKDALVRHLNDRDIYDCTLRIPFPYTEAAAEQWLAFSASMAKQQGPPAHLAIRNSDDDLIGGCGFDGLQVGKSHRADLGYWLAKPYWGRGIMTAVVLQVCRHAFQELGLAKITAHVFPHNRASARVLEKCGFQEEGFLRQHFLKDGHLLDARLFALLEQEVAHLRHSRHPPA